MAKDLMNLEMQILSILCGEWQFYDLAPISQNVRRNNGIFHENDELSHNVHDSEEKFTKTENHTMIL
jgi:hypothetical protein